MTKSATLDEVLARHRTGLSAAEFVTELDAALSLAGNSGAAPLSASETTFLAAHGGPGVAEALAEAGSDQQRRDHARAATRRVADAVAESLSIAGAAQVMGVDRSRISHRLRDGTLWSFTLGRQRRIPRWQIMLDGQPLPGLTTLVRAIPPGVGPRTVAGFMRTPQPEFGDQPAESFLAGGGDPAVVADALADLGRW